MFTYNHTGIGVPELGQKISYQAFAIARGPTNIAVFQLGSSRTSWGGGPLPLHLSFLGAPGCYWRTNSLIQVGLTVTKGRVILSNILIPLDKTLIGVTVYTQFVVDDKGYNAANFITTNGIKTTIGGQK